MIINVLNYTLINKITWRQIFREFKYYLRIWECHIPNINGGFRLQWTCLFSILTSLECSKYTSKWIYGIIWMFWAYYENFDFLNRKYINENNKRTINDDLVSISMLEKHLVTPGSKCKSKRKKEKLKDHILYIQILSIIPLTFYHFSQHY